MNNNKKIIIDTANFYNTKLKRFGNNFKGMNWPSQKNQYLRFEQLIKIDNLRNKTIHDLGCGNGELLKFLKEKKIIFSKYFGSDISDFMVDAAKNNFYSSSKICFEKINILETKKKIMHDYVITSGIFNVKNQFSYKDWVNYVFQIIIKMYSFSRLGIGFNLLTFDVDYKNKDLFYMSVDRLISFLRTKVSKKIIVNHSYPLWEYTIFVYK